MKHSISPVKTWKGRTIPTEEDIIWAKNQYAEYKMNLEAMEAKRDVSKFEALLEGREETFEFTEVKKPPQKVMEILAFSEKFNKKNHMYSRLLDFSRPSSVLARTTERIKANEVKFERKNKPGFIPNSSKIGTINVEYKKKMCVKRRCISSEIRSRVVLMRTIDIDPVRYRSQQNMLRREKEETEALSKVNSLDDNIYGDYKKCREKILEENIKLKDCVSRSRNFQLDGLE